MGKFFGKYYDDKRRAKGELVGGGHFVFRRGRKFNRVRFVVPKGGQVLPFEHATFALALAECERLAKINPGQKYGVFSQVAERHVPAQGNSI